MKTYLNIIGIAIGGIVIGAICMAGGAAAQTCDKPDGFPERPLTMIVPYGPGGGSGQVSRAMIQGVKDVSGIDINANYKPGGAGIVGLRSYMATPKDGYTVLEHIDDASSAYAAGRSDVNPAVDLIPLVTSQITFSQVYSRSSEDRFTDWASFVAYCKAQAGKCTLANVAGEGSMERLNMNRTATHFGFKIQQISFDKGGPRYAALKGGQVDALFEQPGDVKGFLDSGDFKPILTFLAERPAAFPDTPSMTDVGLTFTPLMRFRGFYVHQGAPADRVAYLQCVFQNGFQAESYQAFNTSKFMDLIPSFRDTEGSIKLIQETVEIYKQVYKDMGLIQ